MLEVKRIALDYDSCLNDNDAAWTKWASQHFNANIDRSHLADWDFMAREFPVPEVFNFFCAETYEKDIIQPVAGAEQFVRKLEHAFGEENVFIVTSSTPGTEKAKDDHIKRHFGLPTSRIIHAKDKTPHTESSILVDDYPEHVLSHIEKNSTPGLVLNHGGLCPIGFLDNYDSERVKRAGTLISTCHSFDEVLQNIFERKAA